jgi:hypothetical protein
VKHHYWLLSTLFTLVAAHPNLSYAQIFGPRSFEDCVNDLVKSANNPDYGVAQNLCRKRFPKLSDIARGRDAFLVCEDTNEKSIYRISIQAGKLSIAELASVSFETTLRTKESFSFKGSSEEKGSARKVTIYGKLETESGSGRLIVEYEDKRSKDYIYNFNCTERAR